MEEISPYIAATPSPASPAAVTKMRRERLVRLYSATEGDPMAVVPVLGNEGMTITAGSHTGKCIGIFTSGGDSQGMNAAVRAVVRMGSYVGCTMYFIKEGYQGMVDGNIEEATWKSVSGIIQMGGTVIGSARCEAFRSRSGRMKATCNLVQHGITDLVVIGGDGSLTGADVFREEWPSLLEDLFEEGKLTQEQYASSSRLNIVGLVGSIDNDFCGTDMTIGADSALHRIMEAVDAITTTAQSHQRTFVMELMGRHCGYLGLVTGLASEADFIFIPEWPAKVNWPEKMCGRLRRSREMGQRLNIILVTEGAIDVNGNPISAKDIQRVIEEELNQDVRITVLGHVQRGGKASAYDRILGTRMGAEAVLALMDSGADMPASVIGLSGNQIVRVPLVECVAKTKAVQKAMDHKKFELAQQLRGRSFLNNLAAYKKLSKLHPPATSCDPTGTTCVMPQRLAVMCVGAPAGGMNPTIRAFARLAMFQGYSVMGIYGGCTGAAKGEIKPIKWNELIGWSRDGGTYLGTNKETTTGLLPNIAAQFRRHRISGLVVVGGFEAYEATQELATARANHPEFCIPMTIIPCTISNNVPGTEFSLGADTALNEIAEMCDRIKQSALGTRKRVFIVETMGGYCGYLATLSALAGGADAAYIFEEPFNIEDLQNDVQHLASKIDRGVQRGLILRNENANANYTTNFIHQLFSEEGKECFTTRKNVLGHMQQGGRPSPFDRNMGMKMGSKALDWMILQMQNSAQPDGTVFTNRKESATLQGLKKRHTYFTPLQDLVKDTDYEHRMSYEKWWMKLRPLLRIMAQHKAAYEISSVQMLRIDSSSDVDQAPDTE
ncbi:PREDICTED: ATP-dependent 6-phosphofructokinase-like isoform X2 [Priapulus caudatus]|uniref:ATP-dependent 6-phosphofructokinase n=1 Tax=Priapulus caudatus TaxID=37621 RepID=A0ABM1EQY7_PRICU|nr:PREDICTED: ATP-dependent 6-phosphofructokinase-like isoform X2 [Priapulus caudatus]